ncbi:hypothetical protein [Rhizobium sp. BK251]|uniref:hypothetical protein n=1 Tax=Rhizobium sp. BK251 TaxID=2512125 RepID=UPI001043A47A|nr:hypothetical protein [Rhizobium sp. BK251]
MIKTTIIALALAAATATSALAACFGSGNFQSCNDMNGNSYSVQRFGNSTMMQGYNANTGSSWSQNSQHIGNSTYTNGMSADGGSWNLQQHRMGNTTIYSGTDSDGNFFSGSCGAFGCN